MDDGGPAAPQPSPVSNSTTCTTPYTFCATGCTKAQPGTLPQLNWLYFKSEFVGKPDEDAEAHLLITNKWMDTHVFQEDVKVQRFWFTLVEEAKL